MHYSSAVVGLAAPACAIDRVLCVVSLTEGGVTRYLRAPCTCSNADSGAGSMQEALLHGVQALASSNNKAVQSFVTTCAIRM